MRASGPGGFGFGVGDESDVIDAYTKGTPELRARLAAIKVQLLQGVAEPEQKGFWEAVRVGLDVGLKTFRASKRERPAGYADPLCPKTRINAHVSCCRCRLW
jgi:hypothetical protein